MEQGTLSKARRSANFTANEKHHLYNLISNKYGHILEDRKTDRSSVAQKFMTWKQIERELNAESPNSIAEEKKRRMLTGGGPMPVLKKDSSDDLLISILNEKTLHGAHNEYDSDRATGPIKNRNVEIEYILDNEQEENYAECSLMDDDSSINTYSNPGPSSHVGDKTEFASASSSTSKRALDSSRRRPTKTIRTLTSSDVSNKYNLLLDKRLVLVEMQIKQLDEEREFRRQKEMDLLKAEIAIKSQTAMPPKKRVCKFNSELAQEYPYIKRAKLDSDSDVICNKCMGKFSIAAGGRMIFYDTINKCPVLIKDFFTDQKSELWLKFIHCQSALFHDTMIESNKSTVVQVSAEFDKLILKLRGRADATFVPLIIRNDLRKLTEEGDINKEWFMCHVNMFYQNCIDYIVPRISDFSTLNCFQWTELNTVVEWTDVQTTFEFISNKISNKIEENDLFDEVTFLNHYLRREEIITKWNHDNIEIDMRWVEVFNYFRQEHIPFSNLLNIVQYSLCLPGTNAPTERVFSIMNNIWTAEKSQLSTQDTIPAAETEHAEFIDTNDENANVTPSPHSSVSLSTVGSPLTVSSPQPSPSPSSQIEFSSYIVPTPYNQTQQQQSYQATHATQLRMNDYSSGINQQSSMQYQDPSTASQPEKCKVVNVNDIIQRAFVMNIPRQAKLNKQTSILSFDLQQALPVPNLTVGPALYLRKILTYNLGVHDCVTGLGYMYMWPENVAKRGSEEIASILYKHLKENAAKEAKHFTVFTDNCGGQNKNWALICLWQQLVQEGVFELNIAT
ncbi:hypothetical protein NQ314_020989 [Rhamnusium bicolor]|uniref:Regulatory protein zeste n=1 Tax=Rhamnusium bicolor TaxID=1586634 RepID=A0AAV8WK84_9CUCU|nr:hypothetical protein NQ314_020989 [Rhamnusium bicolor]